MSNEERMGYHKGALESLVNEKIELSRLLSIVDSLIQRHSKALQEMGVDVEKFMENVQKKREEKTKDTAQKNHRKGGDTGLSDERLPE